MSPTATTTKKLSGGAKGHLKDLILLDEKTTLEMARGIAESYLDRDGAIALAEKLGVEPPRVKRRFYRYFTRTTAYSIGIDAYTEEEADAEAQRMQDLNAAQDDIHYGNYSSFQEERSRLRHAFSDITSVRPRVQDLHNPHPFEVQRAEAVDKELPRPGFSDRIKWDSLIGR